MANSGTGLWRSAGDLQTGYIVQNTTANDTESITYDIERDDIGNPTAVKRDNANTHAYTWEHGRQLAALTQDGATWNFTYNADGIRTKRVSDDVTYSYVYNGSSLSQMTVGENQLNFFYDANSAPMVVLYNGITYYYVTNLQGDVIAILDSNGNAVVEYIYDAWGKLLSTTGSMATSLGVHNPLRYRAYVYDPETSLYYVSSRYYDPEIGRWINADALVSTGQGILGNNMFAYCLNNPANYVDRDGTNAEALQLWAAGMGWLPFADAILPVGDIIYISGLLLLSAIALSSDQDCVPEISYDVSDVAYGPPSPDNDDDGDDDYYDDDSNFGGRQKIGKRKGNTPANNKVQNKQFKDATKGVLNKDQQRALHDEISGEGYGFHDIVAAARKLWIFFVSVLYDQDQ